MITYTFVAAPSLCRGSLVKEGPVRISVVTSLVQAVSVKDAGTDPTRHVEGC